MASVYQLKSAFQQLLRPLVGRLARGGVTANQVTIAALVLSVAHGVWIGLSVETQSVVWALALLPVMLFVRMALNAIDGMLAREYGQTSRKGAVLNELGDLLSDAALYLPIALVAGFHAGFVVLIVVLALVGEAVGILAQALGGVRNYAGPMGKSDRAAGFGFLGVWMALGEPQIFGVGIVDPLLIIMVSLSVVTVWNRTRAAIGAPHKAAGEV